MLKLLIVDDEEMICQAIADIIDWKSYDIQLIGTCLDGVDAYHTILDENPDIVMTDIRMPGISGLELIERIHRTDLCTQFIILSGYGEFDYAKRAMKCGVRHYLLKPCTEEQIVECIKDVAKDYYQTLQEKEVSNPHHNTVQKELHRTLIQNMIREGISYISQEDAFFESYEHYLNLTDMPYQFCCVYYLEEKNLSHCLELFQDFWKSYMQDTEVYLIYIKNILLFFFPDVTTELKALDHFFEKMHFPAQTVSIDYSRRRYPDMKSLMRMVIRRVKRYDVLYFIEGLRKIPNFNYGQIVKKANQLVPMIASSKPDIQQHALQELSGILTAISSKDFLLQLSDNLIVSLGTHLPSRTLPELTEFLYELHKEEDFSIIEKKVLEYIEKLTESKRAPRQYSPFIAKLMDYVYQHYDNPDLTLKWISENYLFMNVSYVSRSFTKETGEKFSSFLMKLRIQKAKEILATKDNEKIQNVAELVGCGNTPYYFSKIFKKCTGLTPSAYIELSR